ncbi:protein transport protein SEC16B homolog isoform X2 [Raphanus sativus]|uniref:Protein transport protein sec16 n=1 Tax=Raphanus sativus TaxID=3726 RepID=A0A6J0NFM2_RAPSA|nr:protein transport protein SEC16B homolog isoform X2 [Raphanus sativus]
MASASQYMMMEDQTDEDFFDKLVDDSYSPTQAQASSSAKQMTFDDGSDSDDIRAFSNLSLVKGDENGTLNEAAEPGNNDVGSSKEEPSSIALEEEEDDVVQNDANNNKLSDDDVMRLEVDDDDDKPLSETGKESKVVNEAGGSHGVKEIDWGAFGADSSANDGRGFGSYSDFFTEFDGHLQGKAEVDGGNLVSNADDTNNTSVVASAGFEQQHQGEVVLDSTSGQYVDNSQSWENMYPGWRYDANTGQWYQVDGQDASMISQESYGNSASNWEGVAADNSTATVAENVSAWNQVSQVSNGYPENMVFDAQYPGWYYDTIAQEWRSLDSYNQASQTPQAHDQNGHAMYHNNSESSMYNVNDTKQTFQGQEFGMQSQQGSWDQSYSANNQQTTNTWQSGNGGQAEAAVTSASLSNFGGNQQVNNLYNTRSVAEQFKPNETGVQGFIPQHMNVASVTQNGPLSFSNDFYNSQQQYVDDVQQSYQSNQVFSPSAGRSPDGRPPHALVNFGFGGKIIVMKDDNGSFQNSSFGSQGTGGSSISLVNLAEVICGSASYPSPGENSSSYFHCLHQQPLPGPLVGGNVGSKDLNKWFDERILHCESSGMDFSSGKLLKMLLSLLRISCQYYGKLRSPFGTDTTQKETDSAEAAVAKLFAFAKKDAVQNGYAPFSQCLQQLPPESQLQATASEVQNLLASGRKMEALQCAQEGHLWGPALVIAAQLGQQFYGDTVKQMALRQLVPGSPLRTLCLLVAGQPAEVFSTGSTSDLSSPGSLNVPQQQAQFGSSSMLDNWEENLGVITANRTTDDELVITHLGDCMWKERGEIMAAHICYLIADKNFDQYSDSARLCLVGGDHWKYPRTYASPEAIQRTELYEYSKTLGNSQFILLPFQPYKVIYAHMLAEVGKLSAAQKYCQAVLKCLKTGRSPEADTWKQCVSSLEERIRIHQQGGYTANLAPTKLVGRLLNLFDSTANRVVGGMPPPAPHSTTGSLQSKEYHHQQQEATKLPYSQSVNTMSSLMPPASVESLHESGGNVKRTAVHTRSVSEPDFGRTPIQDLADCPKEKVEGATKLKSSGSVTGSRFSRFGFGMLKDTVGRVLQSRSSSKEAKLGAENQFYYDDKLKRWVEKGVEPPAEEAALPPPPTLGTYKNNSLSYENKSEMNPPSGSWSSNGPTPSENSSGMPPLSQSSNQFSARGRMGVRARYVDTFNQGRGNSQTMFQSHPAQSAKPPIPAKAKFFIPATPASSSNGHASEPAATETRQEENSAEEVAASSRAPPQMTMQRFPSMDNIQVNGLGISANGDHPPPASRRTASWSGNFNTSFTSPTSPPTFKPVLLNGGSIVEELQEVEL